MNKTIKLNNIKNIKKVKKKNNLTPILIVISLIIIVVFFVNEYSKKEEYKKTYEFKLTQIGYDLKTANKLEEDLTKEQLDILLSKDVIVGITKLIESKYFIFNNLDRYVQNYDYSNIDFDIDYLIRKVNVNRDKSNYVEPKKANINLINDILVNQYYFLGEDYVPDNLVKILGIHTFTEEYIQEEVYESYKLMYKEALNEGIRFLVTSGYRSYNNQEAVYDDYVKRYGQDYAKNYVAVPGYSEHQTGLALDIFTYGSTMKTFDTTEGFKWLSNNAYKYGFILRYPKDKINLTGATYESWHYRYVGKNIAKQIYEENISFEEYYAFYVENIDKDK